MLTKICIALGFGFIILLLNAMSYKRGKDAEHIRQLKEEIDNRAKEQAYANSKIDFVRNLDGDSVSGRLSELAQSNKRNNL